MPGYALHHYSYAELLHNKKLRERKSKKGIVLRDIASKVQFIADSLYSVHIQYTS